MARNDTREALCSRCGNAHDRGKQKYCRDCHAAYMRAWRKITKMTPEQMFKDPDGCLFLSGQNNAHRR